MSSIEARLSVTQLWTVNFPRRLDQKLVPNGLLTVNSAERRGYQRIIGVLSEIILCYHIYATEQIGKPA